MDILDHGIISVEMPRNSDRQKVLIVDDEIEMTSVLNKVLQRKCQCDIRIAVSGEDAYALMSSWHPDVILTDVKMPGMDGLSLLKRVKEFDPNISVIIMTGFGTIDMAVEALKEGAYDFFQKPFDNDRLVHVIRRSLERTRLLRENQKLQQFLKGQSTFHGFVGQSKKLREVLEVIARVAEADVTVLIRGESGTGKELAARALHALSKRAHKKMVTVNCPALPEMILESELFGYKRGAFTGATKDKDGLFVAANGSTILLDEIGDIPISIQTKLLRVLQEKEVRPLGQTRTHKVDVRVLASTNQDLERKIKDGQFREDLYYRLNVVTITMPTLREMKEDIPILAQHFLRLYAEKHGKQGIEFSPDAIECMMRREWKGNVRELQNTIERAVLLCAGDLIVPSDLKSEEPQEQSDCLFAYYELCGKAYPEAKEEILSRFSKVYLAEALRKTRGNVTAAAKNSGIERQAFQRLMRKYGLKSSDFRSEDTKQD